MDKRIDVNFSAVEYYVGSLYDEDYDLVMAYAKEHDCTIREAVEVLFDEHKINLWDCYDEVMTDDVTVDDAEALE